MQALLPASSGRNPNGHTVDTVRRALLGLDGSRRWSFRYALLDRTNAVLLDHLDGVMSCTVEQNWLADIKRTMKLTMRDTGQVDYLVNRIQPNARLHLPPYGTEDWVEWPLGVFMLSAPKRKAESTGKITREVTGLDQLQLYADDCVEKRYTVAKGANIIATVVANVAFPGSVRRVVAPLSTTMPAARAWDPGTSRLRIINDLLGMVNYHSLAFDEEGAALIQPYVNPDQRADEWTYADDDYGLMVPGMEEELDLDRIPNHWVMNRSDPDKAHIMASYTNMNPASPTSVPSRGRRITDHRTASDAAGPLALASRVAKLAFQASQVFQTLTFETGFNPLHSGNDVYRLRYGPLNVNASYSEQSWSMTLEPGSRMKHAARRVVKV